MVTYTCPLCQQKTPRDLAVFLEHTNSHVIDKIKESHPEWVEKDGVCQPCLEYYKTQLSGESANINLGPKELGKRRVLGASMLVLSFLLVWWMNSSGASQNLRFLLFIPLFLAMLGFLQAKGKTCALLALAGKKNMDDGENQVQDTEISRQLKGRGIRILIQSFVSAFVITLLCYYLF